MKVFAGKSTEDTSKAKGLQIQKDENTGTSAPPTMEFVDNRSEIMTQRKRVDALNQSPRVTAQRTVRNRIHNSPYVVAQQKRLRGLSGERTQLGSESKNNGLIRKVVQAVRVGYYRGISEKTSRLPQGDPTLQLETYYRSANGDTGDIAVEAQGKQVKLWGSTKPRSGGQRVHVTGSVSLHPVDIPESKLLSTGDPETVIPCLRVFGIQTSERGLRLGQLLTYHHACYAKQRGINYIVAQSVSGAGGGFYLPLGFRDFLGDETWQDLHRESQDLDFAIRSMPQNLPPTPEGTSPMEGLVSRLVKTKEKLSNVSMFIPTDELIANSYDAFRTRWVPTSKRGG